MFSSPAHNPCNTPTKMFIVSEKISLWSFKMKFLTDSPNNLDLSHIWFQKACQNSGVHHQIEHHSSLYILGKCYIEHGEAMTCALCSKHVYNKSITVVAAPLRNSSGMYCVAYFHGISRTMLSARAACASGIRAAYIHIFMHTLVYLNIWILTISEHIFPAACPRTIIKYLANKCVRTLIRRILFSSSYNIYVISAQF